MFVFCIILCYATFDMFYILLGDDPCCMDQLNNKTNTIQQHRTREPKPSFQN